MENRTVYLPITSCFLLDFPKSGEDCSSNNVNRCVGCKVLGRFLTGEPIEDVGSTGHIICVIIWLITVLIAICGLFGNIFIIYILHRQKKGTAFDTFLMSLACMDIVVSVSSAIATTASFLYFQNFSQGRLTLSFFQLGSHTAVFAESCSSFTTVVITVERYLAVAFPLKSRNLVNKTRIRLLVAGVVLFSFVMALPRYSSAYVAKNEVGWDIKSTRHLEYMIQSTSLRHFWYGTMKGFFNQVDFWLPLPLLLLFNGLIYMHVLKFNSRRQDMKVGQRKEIRAVKMFLPVVVVLFLCNIIPIIDYTFMHNGVVYREIHLAIFTSFAFNSAANLPIYYSKGAGFRKETRAVLTEMFPALDKWLPQVDKSTTSATESSHE